MRKQMIFLLSTVIFTWTGCTNSQPAEADNRIPVLFDTDANNELDDQHAMAYLLMNNEALNTVGITVNATSNGGDISEQVKEAERVIRLCGLWGHVALKAGADGNFPEIRSHLFETGFDGSDAVDFIIRESLKQRKQKLVLLPVGKLTNIALALQKEPSIAEKVRIVWLGSNYPEPGEYNLENDTAALNYILDLDVPFEMVTVRYGQPSGTGAVTASQEEIFKRMPGMGPRVEEAVEGRHGGSFHTFGDYSVNLFSHAEFWDEGKNRSLFDMAAVAIVKKPGWAQSQEIPAPLYLEDSWVERPGNQRKVLIWENFNREEIMADFYASFPKENQ